MAIQAMVIRKGWNGETWGAEIGRATSRSETAEASTKRQRCAGGRRYNCAAVSTTLSQQKGSD